MGRRHLRRRFRPLLPEEHAESARCSADALLNTGILAFWVFALMIPLALVTGVLAGIREGSVAGPHHLLRLGALHLDPRDRHGDHPDRHLRARPRLAAGQVEEDEGFDSTLVLPVLTLVLYDFGYVARMTRASVAEVMTSQYMRTAVLKGIPYRRVIMRHVLRNALIAPFTVIVLQLNWLLSGVVVVEVFFQYDGFGKLLLDAALFGDLYVVQAATLAAVLVAVLSQLISDVGYTFLNPRIRFT